MYPPGGYHLPQRDEPNLSWDEAILTLLSSIILIALLYGIITLASIPARWLADWYGATYHSFWLPTIVVAGLFGFGLLLFLLKIKHRFLYGLIEISFALASALRWFFGYQQDNNLNLLAAIGVVYLVVRGLDNCREAVKASVKSVEQTDDHRQPLVQQDCTDDVRHRGRPGI